MRKLAIFTILTLLFGMAWAADSVPTFHNDSQRTGRTENVGPETPLLLWSFKAAGSFSASPVIAEDGTIYVASADHHLYALNSDGTQKWAFETEESVFGTPALAQDGSVLFGDLAGRFYAVNPDGTEKWLYRFRSGKDKRIISSPVVDANGISYIGCWNKEFHAVDDEGIYTEDIRLNGLLTSPPALDDEGNIYIAEKDGNDLKVHKYQPELSSSRWTFTKKLNTKRDRVVGSPAIDLEKGQLYVAACRRDDGVVYGIDTRNGREEWRKTLPKGVISSPAIGHDGTVYVGCLGGAEVGDTGGLAKNEFGLLYALDPDDGSEKWTFQVDGYFIYGSPCVDGNGVIYVGDSDGILYAISPEGNELWRFETQANIASAPVIGNDGTLYVTSFDSTLYAITNPTAVIDWREF